MSTVTKSLKGTKTLQNIVNSYMAESQSYARYVFSAHQADKENYYPVGVIFNETANNELHHAKIFLKMLQDEEIDCSAPVDAGYFGNTVTNLQTAIKEESTDGYEFYTACAQTAREEGFNDVASHFDAIAQAEKFHHDRFQHFLQMIQDGTLWKREKPVTWKCLVCGYTYVGTEPPVKCPGCDHPYQHYIAVEDEYVPAPQG